MFVLDSDILSIIQARDGEAFHQIASRISRVDPATVYVTMITFHEQANGWGAYIRRARKSGEVVYGYRMYERMLTEFFRLNVLSFDEAAARVFDDLKSQKIRVGTMDLRIASVALSLGYTVVTRNTVDFERIPGLMVQDWTV